MKKKQMIQRINLLEECVVRLLNDITILAAKQELDSKDIDFIFDNHDSRLDDLEHTPDCEVSTSVVHATQEDWEAAIAPAASVPVDIFGRPIVDEDEDPPKRSLYKMIFG